MSDPHRDELAAAYQRIAALEAKIDELTAPLPGPEDAEVTRLQQRLAVVKSRPPSWEAVVLAAPLPLVLLVPAIALASSGPNPPLSLIAFIALLAVVGFIAFHRFVKRTMLRGHARTVADAEKAVAEARAHVRVRIDVPRAPETETEDEPESEARIEQRR